jgi:hypothetical protein
LREISGSSSRAIIGIRFTGQRLENEPPDDIETYLKDTNKIVEVLTFVAAGDSFEIQAFSFSKRSNTVGLDSPTAMPTFSPTELTPSPTYGDDCASIADKYRPGDTPDKTCKDYWAAHIPEYTELHDYYTYDEYDDYDLEWFNSKWDKKADYFNGQTRQCLQIGEGADWSMENCNFEDCYSSWKFDSNPCTESTRRALAAFYSVDDPPASHSIYDDTGRDFTVHKRHQLSTSVALGSGPKIDSNNITPQRHVRRLSEDENATMVIGFARLTSGGEEEISPNCLNVEDSLSLEFPAWYFESNKALVRFTDLKMKVDYSSSGTVDIQRFTLAIELAVLFFVVPLETNQGIELVLAHSDNATITCSDLESGSPFWRFSSSTHTARFGTFDCLDITYDSTSSKYTLKTQAIVKRCDECIMDGTQLSSCATIQTLDLTLELDESKARMSYEFDESITAEFLNSEAKGDFGNSTIMTEITEISVSNDVLVGPLICPPGRVPEEESAKLEKYVGTNHTVKRSVCEEPPGYRDLIFPDYTYYLIYSFPSLSETWKNRPDNIADFLETSLAGSKLNIMYSQADVDDFDDCSSDSNDASYGLCNISASDHRAETDDLDDTFHIFALSFRIDSSLIAPSKCEAEPCTLLLRTKFGQDEGGRRRMLAAEKQTGGSSSFVSRSLFSLPPYDVTIQLSCGDGTDVGLAMSESIVTTLGCNKCVWSAKFLGPARNAYVFDVRSRFREQELLARLQRGMDLTKLGIAPSCLDIQVAPARLSYGSSPSQYKGAPDVLPKQHDDTYVAMAVIGGIVIVSAISTMLVRRKSDRKVAPSVEMNQKA